MPRIAISSFTFAFFVATYAAAEVCVENASGESWLFTAADDVGARASAMLAPEGRLCLKSEGPGTITVFENAEALEGCSRRVANGSFTRMLDFPGVDLCAWEAAP
ncbi:MAG: hypothetical protein ACR2O1_07435 [Boseongicola sp.]